MTRTALALFAALIAGPALAQPVKSNCLYEADEELTYAGPCTVTRTDRAFVVQPSLDPRLLVDIPRGARAGEPVMSRWPALRNRSEVSRHGRNCWMGPRVTICAWPAAQGVVVPYVRNAQDPDARPPETCAVEIDDVLQSLGPCRIAVEGDVIDLKPRAPQAKQVRVVQQSDDAVDFVWPERNRVAGVLLGEVFARGTRRSGCWVGGPNDATKICGWR